MDLASVVAALASVGVRVSGSTPNSSVQVDSSRACPTGLAGPEPSGTINDPGQHFQRSGGSTHLVFWVRIRLGGQEYLGALDTGANISIVAKNILPPGDLKNIMPTAAICMGDGHRPRPRPLCPCYGLYRRGSHLLCLSLGWYYLFPCSWI